MIINVNKTTESKHTHTIKLSGDAIAELLALAGYEVPTYADVVFEVPGGGDYSNTDVDVTGEDCVRVTWTTTRAE